MRYIFRPSDVILLINLRDCSGETLPITSLDYIEYKFYVKNTSGETFTASYDKTTGGTNITVETVSGVTTARIIMEGTDVNKFSEGILRYECQIRLANTRLQDQEQDIYIKKQTDIYIK